MSTHHQRLVALVVLPLLFVAAAVGCTDEQIARFKASPPDVQAAWIRGIQEHQEQVRTQADGHRRAIQRHPFLTCVRRHESDRGAYPHTNGYGAQNPRSTASGAYQFLDSTWRNVSARAGHGGYAKAKHAPWYVQDAVALYLYNNGGKSAWNGTGC